MSNVILRVRRRRSRLIGPNTPQNYGTRLRDLAASGKGRKISYSVLWLPSLNPTRARLVAARYNPDLAPSDADLPHWRRSIPVRAGVALRWRVGSGGW